MKSLNLSTRATLNLSASVSLALVALVSQAPAQTPQIVFHTETVVLRTGNDAAGTPLAPGALDGNITQSIVHGCAPNPNDYNDALAGYPAKVISPSTAWVPSLSDPDARWIHLWQDVANPSLYGTPPASVQYAHSFNLPADMPSDANVVLDMEFAADDLVGAVSFGDAISQTSMPGFPGGGFSSSSTLSLSGPANSLGLVAGSNTLFFKACDTALVYSGLIYSVSLTVEYCTVDVDLRSGIREIPDDALVDVVLLADSTQSMNDEITQVQTDAIAILNNLMSGTHDVQVGVADYKDFPAPTVGNPYAFKLGQAVTNNQSAIQSAINGWAASGGQDHPEGQLFALDQLAKLATVGWRVGSVRIIVYFGDAGGHDPICNAISNVGYAITEASLISDLQAAGVYGTTVIAVSSGVGAGTGLNESIPSAGDYIPFCGIAPIIPQGQANRITAATGGLVAQIGNPSQVTSAILGAINTVLTQPFVFPVGSPDLNVKHGPYNVLSSGGGNHPFRISPNSAWVTSLSQSAGWIHSDHNGNIGPAGSGAPPSARLYAHEFTLPPLPTNATVTLDFEWAADETLFGVSMNGDVNFAGGYLNIGGSLNPEYAFASTAQVVGNSLSFQLNPGGVNRLYLATLENFPGGTTVNNPAVVSGIMYIAKMHIAFHCCPHPTLTYETFCECNGEDIAPCYNLGGPDRGCANSTGFGSQLTASGTNPNITLTADKLPMPTIGLFFRGTSQIGPLTFGDGLRCVGGETARLHIVSTGSGSASYGPFASPPVTFYQFWYRDNHGPCMTGFNLSSAILIP